MRYPYRWFLTFVCIFYLSACVITKKPNIDENFLKNASCQELQAELVRVGAIRSDAEHKQGVTGTQVAAGLLFYPLFGIGTSVNQERAMGMAKDAKVALKTIYAYWDRNHCDEEIYRKNKR